MYVLYIANKNYSSWSLRPWVLMRELGIEFKEELRPFNPGSNWTAFRTFSPSGKVPCLVDGEHVVWDSLSIVEYLAERHPSVWPQDPGVRAWARSAAAEMHSGFGALRERCSMSCGIRVRLNDIPAALTRDIERMDELWTQGLDRFGGPFLTGQAFAAVDAFFAPIAFRAQTYGLKFKPRATEYLARLLDLPPMQAWYTAALADPWREDDHEDEVRKTGTIVEDLRTS